MTDRATVARRAERLALPAGMALALAALTACGGGDAAPPEPDPVPRAETQATFAVTSADVAVAPDDEFPVNLIFVAPEDDPIWDGLTGVGVPEGPELSPGEFVIEGGAPVPGGVLGNLTFSLPVGSAGVTFDEVELYLTGQAGPARADVGTWTIAPVEPAAAEVAPVGDVALTADVCGTVSASFRNESAAALTAARATVDAPGASVAAAELTGPAAPGENFLLDLELTCDGTADFYILSPTVTYETAEGEVTTRLDPVTIGLTAITDETVARITARST